MYRPFNYQCYVVHSKQFPFSFPNIDGRIEATDMEASHGLSFQSNLFIAVAECKCEQYVCAAPETKVIESHIATEIIDCARTHRSLSGWCCEPTTNNCSIALLLGDEMSRCVWSFFKPGHAVTSASIFGDTYMLPFFFILSSTCSFFFFFFFPPCA